MSSVNEVLFCNEKRKRNDLSRDENAYEKKSKSDDKEKFLTLHLR